MSIEIGSLVVQGSFGATKSKGDETTALRKEIRQLRSELLTEVRDMIDEIERRRRES